MNILVLLISISFLIAVLFLIGFIWSLRKGQWDDTRTPPYRILFDGKDAKKKTDRKT